MYKKTIKPIFDFLTALFALAVLSPVFIFIVLLLAVSNRGNPFFVQRRPGKEGEIFKIIKFKTMTDQRDKKGRLLPDHLRMNYFGNIIRKTSLDEIPQKHITICKLALPLPYSI